MMNPKILSLLNATENLPNICLKSVHGDLGKIARDISRHRYFLQLFHDMKYERYKNIKQKTK